ncbi:MAG: hypothetical protein INH41_19425, partial [Myxococcaceae bacterium]|nr:hypothetical protein [Myxococcaceae bacterium]
AGTDIRPTTPWADLSQPDTPNTEDPTKKTQWFGFVRKVGVRDAGTLAEAIAAVRAFIEAPLASATNGTPAPGTWRAGGAWG